ncbi:MAG: hypothetical protein BWZ10_02577 [candidate division BRC1 bacterium ADurb.BinA364]|nr:MAG: hypothetical protein BWZ10_02577 [candidate division BRC1 bacterium ADurb.BinA364]
MADRSLTLNRQARIQANVTPQFSKTYLQALHPLLGEAVAAERPLTIQIEPDRFMFPLQGESFWERFRIGDASIDLGRIVLRNDGLMSDLLRLLKVDAPNQLAVDFTPLRIRVADGLAAFAPSMATIGDQLSLMFEGQTDLKNNRMEAQIGLPAKTLERIIDRGELDPNLVFPIPLRGEAGKVRIDYEKAMREIVKLAAQLELEKRLPGAGQAIGELLDGGKVSPDALKGALDKLPDGIKTEDAQGLIDSILGGAKKATPTPAPQATPAANEPPKDEEKKEEKKDSREEQIRNLIGTILR